MRTMRECGTLASCEDTARADVRFQLLKLREHWFIGCVKSKGRRVMVVSVIFRVVVVL